jgi:hypothetical protein
MDGNGGMGLLLIVIVDHSLIPYQAPVSQYPKKYQTGYI